MTRSVKKEQPSDEDVLQAFRACNDLDEAKAVAMAPEIMAVALPVAKSLSLTWPRCTQLRLLLHPCSTHPCGCHALKLIFRFLVCFWPLRR